MKRIPYILASLLFVSCAWENSPAPSPSPGPATRSGFISVDVAGTHGSDFEATDDLKSVRFIVFGDPDGYPRAEVNELRPISPDRVGALRAVFRVSAADKLVVAIANEPAALSGALGDVQTLGQLEQLQLAMGSILSPDHRYLLPGVQMPMTGALRTTKADVVDTEAAARANPRPMTLDRVLARVDVYLSTDIAGGVDLLPGSRVTLRGTCTQTPFVPRERPQQPTELVDREWSGTSLVPQGDEPIYVCSFYAPERLCGTDKPTVDIALNTPHGDKSASIELDIAAVERNHRYVVLGKVRRSIYVGLEVMEWSEGLDRFPLAQYFLSVDRSSLTFAAGGGTQRIAASTNHPDGLSVEQVPAGASARVVGGQIEVTSGGGARRWSFVVRAGNLAKRINVVQL